MRAAPVLTLAWLLSLVLPLSAGAESALLFPEPEIVGDVAANTYDEAGARVGPASLGVHALDASRLRLDAASGIEGAERTEVWAELRRVDGGLRLLREKSGSFNADGSSRGTMLIDHEAGTGHCMAPGQARDEGRRIRIPSPDRVANVPLHLLFLPLARGRTEGVAFQILICSFGPRILDARARVVERRPRPDGGELVELSYDLDLPPLLARMARPLLPDVSLWVDESSPGGWVGHRMPLFVSGPTVTVLRQGSSLGLVPSGN